MLSARGAMASAPARLEGRAAVGSTKTRSRSPGGSVNSRAPSSADSAAAPVPGASPAAGRGRGRRRGCDLTRSALAALRCARRRGCLRLGRGRSGRGRWRGDRRGDMTWRRGSLVPRRLELIDELQACEFDIARREVLAVGRKLRLRRPLRCRRMQDLVGASFHLERRLAGRSGRRFAGRRKRGRILRKARERIEHLAAPAAAYLTAGGAQRLGRQLEDRLAVGALRVQARSFSERGCRTNRRALSLAR